MLFYQILASNIHEKNMKRSCKNKKVKISAPTWIEKIELPDGSYSSSDNQSYFEYITKKLETLTGNPRIRIQVNTIENRITFKINSGY